MRSVGILTLPFIVLGASTAGAQPYLRLDIGTAWARSVALKGDGYDSATRCDWITNPERIEAGPECDGDIPLSEWRDHFDGGRGVASGAAVGHSRGRARVELEYFHRATAYDQTFSSLNLDAVGADKLEQEIASGSTTVWDLESHSVLVNFLYDLPVGRRWEGFFGGGLGASRATVDYATIWRRHHDPERITTFTDPLMRARLAGTTTIGHARLHDVVFVNQALFGINRRVSDRVLLGVTLRWVNEAGFKSPETTWDQLRSHESSTGRGDEVWYRVKSDLAYWSATLGLTVRFPRR